VIYWTFFERIAHQSRGGGGKLDDEDFGARVTVETDNATHERVVISGDIPALEIPGCLQTSKR